MEPGAVPGPREAPGVLLDEPVPVGLRMPAAPGRRMAFIGRRTAEAGFDMAVECRQEGRCCDAEWTGDYLHLVCDRRVAGLDRALVKTMFQD